MRGETKNIGKLALLAVFLSCALIMGVIEALIPLDFIAPGVKLGLANVVVLASLYLFRRRDVLKIVLLKCLVSSILYGSFFSFLYSLAGSMLSFLAMYALIRFAGDRISPVGVSVCGAVSHNIGQILVAACLLSSLSVAAYLPALLLSGVITGVLTGLAVRLTLTYIRTHLTIIDKSGAVSLEKK